MISGYQWVILGFICCIWSLVSAGLVQGKLFVFDIDYYCGQFEFCFYKVLNLGLFQGIICSKGERLYKFIWLFKIKIKIFK